MEHGPPVVSGQISQIGEGLVVVSGGLLIGPEKGLVPQMEESQLPNPIRFDAFGDHLTRFSQASGPDQFTHRPLCGASTEFCGRQLE